MMMLILGAAVTGRSLVGLARRSGYDIVLYDRDPAAVAAFDPGPDLRIVSGDWDPALLEGVDVVVASPGFPEHAGAIPDVIRSGVPLWSEIEFAATHLEVPYAAVTGTNGKTTVTDAAAAMLQASGIPAVAAGNIGRALSEVVPGGDRVVVIEASSFQLRFTTEFHPRAAALLNIAPDHLDWHADMAEYVAAKRRIFANQTPEDVLAFDVDDPGARAAVADAPSHLVPVSGAMRPSAGNGPEGDWLVIDDKKVPRPDLDRAYTMDLVAAATIASHLGASESGIEEIVTGFTPGAHRRSVVGSWDGVTWVDDSKATNPHAAVASVAAYDRVVLIAGGRNKGLDLSPISQVPTLRLMIGIGEAAIELAGSIEPARFVAVGSLREAVARADEVAAPGDTVLLAPGCASFDMFDSYAARGDEFRRLVLLKKEADRGN